MKKRTAALFIVCAMLIAVLAGCSDNTATSQNDDATSSQQTQTSGTTLVEIEQAEDNGGSISGKDGRLTKLTCSGGVASELSPFQNTGGGHMLYKAVVYMKLAYWVGEDMYSDCAESIEMVDEFNYRVKLYDGIYDSAGYTFNADDLVFCLETAKSMGKISAFSNLESVTKEDELTVLITMNSNISSAFMDLCTSSLLVTQESYEESPDEMATDPVGFTQYKVTGFTASNSVIYEKVDNYWQKDESLISRHYEANVDVIEIDMLSESAQKVSGIKTGDLQMINEIGYVNVQSFVGNSDYYIDEEICLSDCMAVFFNMTSEGACADDIYLRQAILYAIDKQSLLDSQGAGATLKDFSASLYSNFNEEWLDEDYFDYNPDKAVELLKQSNYKGESLRLLSAATEAYKTLCEIIIADLEAVGIKCEMVVREAAAWTSATYASAQEYDIMIKGVGYTSGRIEDCYRKVGSDTVSDIPGTTIFGWDNQEFIDLCNEIAVVNGVTAEKVEQIHDMAYDNAIGMGLYCSYQDFVGVSTITDIWQLGTNYIPNATHFSADYSVYAD